MAAAPVAMAGRASPGQVRWASPGGKPVGQALGKHFDWLWGSGRPVRSAWQPDSVSGGVCFGYTAVWGLSKRGLSKLHCTFEKRSLLYRSFTAELFVFIARPAVPSASDACPLEIYCCED